MKNLNERQIDILKIIAKFGTIGMETLRNRYDISSIAILEAIKRLEKNKYVIRNKIFHNGETYITLDEKGSYLLGTKLIKKINHITLIHDDFVNKIAINEIKKNNEIKLEYELKQENFVKFEKSQSAIFPDLVINDEIAVEVEISLKDINRIKQKILKLETTKYQKIKWISNSKLILNKLMQNTRNEKHEFYLFNNDILVNEQITKSINKKFEL